MGLNKQPHLWLSPVHHLILWRFHTIQMFSHTHFLFKANKVSDTPNTKNIFYRLLQNYLLTQDPNSDTHWPLSISILFSYHWESVSRELQRNIPLTVENCRVEDAGLSLKCSFLVFYQVVSIFYQTFCCSCNLRYIFEYLPTTDTLCSCAIIQIIGWAALHSPYHSPTVSAAAAWSVVTVLWLHRVRSSSGESDLH